MATQGSAEWFYEHSQTHEMKQLNETIEKRRERFIDSFSVARLSEMNGGELLSKVFGNASSSMLRLLLNNDDYRWFGAPGPYKYSGIVYQEHGDIWKYKRGQHSIVVSRSEAEEKAEWIRDQLVRCAQEIEKSGILRTVRDYQNLENRISDVFFYQYSWVMKYYQMLYPQFFPGMYEEKTLNRAIHILGLPSLGKSKRFRFLNAGLVSLFIRRCNVNNIVFNTIYSNEWGWDGQKPPCENAKENYRNSSNPINEVNLGFYRFPTSSEKKRREQIEKAEEIEREISSHHLEGKEKEAVVKVRVNQSEFRGRLLGKYDKCCLCGVSNPALLVASHIKPWSVCEPEERLDEDNGFLLCPNHDKLFDSGLISFDDDGKIIISDEINEFDRLFMNVKRGMKIKGINKKQKEYLSFHREKVFKRG